MGSFHAEHPMGGRAFTQRAQQLLLRFSVLSTLPKQSAGSANCSHCLESQWRLSDRTISSSPAQHVALNLGTHGLTHGSPLHDQSGLQRIQVPNESHVVSTLQVVLLLATCQRLRSVPLTLKSPGAPAVPVRICDTGKARPAAPKQEPDPNKLTSAKVALPIASLHLRHEYRADLHNAQEAVPLPSMPPWIAQHVA